MCSKKTIHSLANGCAVFFSVFLILFLFSPVSGLSQCIDYSDYMHWAGGVEIGDYASGIAVDGEYAFVGQTLNGDESEEFFLAVMDLSAPLTPAMVGSMPLPSRPNGSIVIQENFVYLTAYNGLYVVDITAPETPFIVGSVESPGWLFNLEIQGDYAYMAGGENRSEIFIVDISTPENMTLAGNIATPDHVRDICALGDLLYVADSEEGLLVLDVSSPNSPEIIDVGLTLRHAVGIIAFGEYAYVSDSACVLVLDISTPATPLVVEYLGPDFRGPFIQIQEDRLFMWADGGIKVLNVATPQTPTILGSFSAPGDLHGFAALGNYGYCPATVSLGDLDEFGQIVTYGALQVIDLKNFESPDMQNISLTPEEVLDIKIDGDYGYMIDGDFQVVDLSDPESPEVIANLAFGSVSSSGKARNVILNENHAYLKTDTEFHVIDISTPEAPEIIGSMELTGNVWRSSAQENFVYLLMGGEFVIVDVSVPEGPAIESIIPIWAESFFVQDDYVLFGSVGPGLQVMDISNPENPEIAGTVDLPLSNVFDIAVQDNLGFLVGNLPNYWTPNGLMVVLDLTDFLNPQVINYVQTNFQYPFEITLHGNHAFVGGRHQYFYLHDTDLQIFDITDPYVPVPMGGLSFGMMAWRMSFSPTGIYLAAFGNGLIYAPVQCSDIVSIENYNLDPETNTTPIPMTQLSVFPNPFNPRTTISFTLDHSQTVEIAIFDLTGKRIATLADGLLPAGIYTRDWQGKNLQGRDVASGTYLLRMVTDERISSEKMMLIR